jgi:hypothetical protein
VANTVDQLLSQGTYVEETRWLEAAEGGGVGAFTLRAQKTRRMAPKIQKDSSN